MAVRTFTVPASLNETLAASTVKMTAANNGSARSDDAATRSQESFSKEDKAPLASHTNPNSKPGVTYAHQNKLPKLPIPELNATLKKYVASLEPLQSSKEQRDTMIAVQEFLKSEGPELQDKLKKYASGKSNYIEQFCKSCGFPYHATNYKIHDLSVSCENLQVD